jgi:SnoaL-like polyketide cyclase
MSVPDFVPREFARAALLRQMIEEEGRVRDEMYSKFAVSHKALPAAVAKREREVGSEVDVRKIFAEKGGGLEVSVEDALEAGDKVVIRWRARGTNLDPEACRAAFAACNCSELKDVDISGIYVYRFVGDRIVESWGELDSATLARQTCEEVVSILGRSERERLG